MSQKLTHTENLRWALRADRIGAHPHEAHLTNFTPLRTKRQATEMIQRLKLEWDIYEGGRPKHWRLTPVRVRMTIEEI